MHSKSLVDIPKRLRNIRSFLHSNSSSVDSNAEHIDSQTPSISSSVSSAPPSVRNKQERSGTPPTEYYIPPTPWEPTTNEHRRLSSVADFLLRRKSEPSCTPRRTTEKAFAKLCAKWAPDRPLKYPNPPTKEHAEMLEAWSWKSASAAKPELNLKTPILPAKGHVDDDSCSCVSPRGSRRNSWSSAYWNEEKIRLQSSKRVSQQNDGALGALDALLSQEKSKSQRR